ncbi:MAG: DUF4258 domain-containing protein [Cytophagales bacterium]|nr:DUF4258 domain-containing protein [Cytophagales bacterium]
MSVNLHPHALERMLLRGANKKEVTATVEKGEVFPAKLGRKGFRRNFSFKQQWKGRFYETKQVEVFAVKENDDWLVITVITRYF